MNLSINAIFAKRNLINETDTKVSARGNQDGLHSMMGSVAQNKPNLLAIQLDTCCRKKRKKSLGL